MGPRGWKYSLCRDSTFEKWSNIGLKTHNKLKKNVKLELNGLFRGAFESKLVSYMSKKYADDDYEVRF